MTRGSDAAALERCIAGGGVAVFPADTVYGLACDPDNEAAVRRLYALKGRAPDKPSAVMFFALEAALSTLPSLGEATRWAFGQLLPGAVSLVVANPDRRFALACGPDPSALGVRVPVVPRLAGARCAVLQSSANLAGGPDAMRLNDVPESIRTGADLVIDGGELPGTPSTVIDLRRFDLDGSWRVLREGAVATPRVAEALAAPFAFDDPAGYLAEIREEIPAYNELQAAVVAATGGGPAVRRILELGTGTGETARRLLETHANAVLVGLDASPAMLARAADVLPADRVTLWAAPLAEPLPEGPFDCVVSALCVHHLPAAAKADLFARVAAVLAPGGRFALGDVVVPPDAGGDAVPRTPLTPGFDFPSSVPEQLAWLERAGLRAEVTWTSGDLAVMVGER